MKMSIFKEKDDFIREALKKQFCHDSDESDYDDKPTDQMVEEAEASPPKKVKLDDSLKSSQTKHVTSSQEVPQIQCIDIGSDSSNSNQIIEISSSDDEAVQPTQSQNEFVIDSTVNEANLSLDNGDREFNLKLTIAGSYQQYPTTYKTKLSQALKSLLDDLGLRNKSLVIMHQSEEISLDQTPQSLNLTPGVILRAIEVSSKESNYVNPDEIKLTLQDGNKRHTKEFSMLKTETFADLKKRYTEEFKLTMNQRIRFHFDGDLLEDDSTPEEFEVEDGCVIDVMIGQ